MMSSQSRPSPRLVWIALGFVLSAAAIEIGGFLEAVSGTSSSAILSGDSLFQQTWLAAFAVAVGITLADRWLIRRVPSPEIRRVLPNSLALHEWADVRVTATFDNPTSSEVLLYDEYPSSMEALELPMRVSAGSRVSHQKYRLRPMVRGETHFKPMRLRASSPLGLWRFTRRCGKAEPVRVYPNFSAITRFMEISLEHRTSEVGIRRAQRRGEGLEFHQLREYRVGDTKRQIDWKATSRKRQLISREYQDERDQHIVFLLDCSRRMRAKDDDLSHFDHGLNAMLMLSHIALRGGDSVGLLSLSEQSRWLPPRKGIATVNRILNSTYDLEASTLGTDFSGAAEELCRRLTRRALIIILTSLRLEDIEDLMPSVEILKHRHLLLVANLCQDKLRHVLRSEVTDFRGAMRYFGIWQHNRDRARVRETLISRGVIALDATPSQLIPRLVNQYYAIKRSGRL